MVCVCVLQQEELAKYDFEFWGWPVDFKWDSAGADGDKKRAQRPAVQREKGQSTELASLPYRILGYLAMHTFGQKMIYPGSTSLMNFLLSTMLNQGRAQLIEDKGGKRAKILTEDQNELDTMFVDRRGQHRNGDTLVIASEGNGGFYEMGCSGTPIEMNFSVLGWNRPGYGGSSGSPWPPAEQKAVEAVMMYAIHKLGFEPQNIVVFAWSIGGYSAALMARSFPDVQYVVLDATFDDLVPLAVSKMPQSWGGLVSKSIRAYMDLNIAEQLLQYQGPILLIRRTRDEMISTDMAMGNYPSVASNRGNNLLIKLLKFRYPTIVDSSTIPVMQHFLSCEMYRQGKQQHLSLSQFPMSVGKHQHLLLSQFPMFIALNESERDLKEKLALFLITMHMDNFESTHNTPLPGKFFRKPWIPGARL
ncbi:abhydrolase domain-containing protein 16a [Plakobranchus ocellatus]|uniref:Abhydrolase domain-containing protein 16a n=1 Tax=Plakobranchus ocellatus TaxID=259542 RepID=A0AAV3XTS5_9GAST|nr:abhydrolase domain-containing protein 16a [Plakobranchus ocellatus]